MPWQLIYTSAPRGLASGQSGFCTVARSAQLREGLVQRLEQLSSYQHLATAATARSAGPNPSIAAYRIVDLRGARYHVLTRVCDAGLDFTSRTNHLAHHLVFEPSELFELPSPAVILRDWDGWRRRWDGTPRLIEDHEVGNLRALADAPLPAQAWLEVTGDSGRAAALLESDLASGCQLLCAPGTEDRLLDLFAETLQLLNTDGRSPGKAWQFPFTTFLQAADDPAEFRWRGVWPGAVSQEASRRKAFPTLEPASLTVPVNALTQLARQGKPAAPPAKTAPPAPQLEAAQPATASSVSSPRPRPSRRQEDWVRDPQPIAAEDEGWRGVLKSRKNLPLLATIAVLLIVLGAGLVFGWFKPRGPGTSPGAATGTLPAAISPSPSAPPQAKAEPSPAPPPAVTQVPDEPPKRPPPKPVARSEPKPPPPAPAAPMIPAPESRLNELLEAQLPRCATFVAVLPRPNAENFALPPAPELEQILQALLRENNHSFLECVLQGGTFVTSKSSAGRAALRSNLAQKWLEAEGGGVAMRLDFADWMAQPVAQAIGLSCAAPPAVGVISATLRSQSGRKPEAGPFRLLLLRPGGKAEPVRLDSGLFVQAGATNHTQWFVPALQRRLDLVTLSPPLRMELRLEIRSAGGGYEDLFGGWPVDDRPGAGQELDLAGLTKRLAESVVECSKEMESLKREKQRLVARARSRDRDRIEELEAKASHCALRITTLNDEIKRLPKTPDQLARISLMFVGSSEPVEFIRFTPGAERGRP